MKNFISKNRSWVAAVAAVVLAFVVGGLVWFSGQEAFDGYVPEELPENGAEHINGNADDGYEITLADSALGRIEITALGSSVLGIARDTQFLVNPIGSGVTVESLSQALSLSEDIGFDIEPNGEGFLLSLHGELPPNTVVNIAYSPPGYQPVRFAFQTMDIFRVTSSTPLDNTWSAPLDTGIEVTFSRPLGVDFSEVFSITPFVAGSFLQRDNTHIFVPDANLEPSTSYTVTVSAQTKSECGEILSEYFVFSFFTDWAGTIQANVFSIAGDAYETFLPWHEVFIALDSSANLADERFRVSVFDLETPERFLAFNPLRDVFGTPFKVFSPTLTRIEVTEWQAASFLFLGETLPPGYYVLRVELYDGRINRTVYKFIQVSPISVYSFSMPGEIVFWINCAYTGNAADGAAITTLGERVFTDSHGVARLETRRMPNEHIFVEYGGSVFAYTTPMFTGLVRPNSRFLTFMYTDRPQYRPNDIVDVFGIILPRYGHEITPCDVFTIRFGDILELPVVLDEYHSFLMRVPVENMFGNMGIVVEVNGERLMSTWVNFSDYTNLNYVITGSFCQTAYFVGDSAVLSVNVTTIAGRPVEGLSMRHQSGHMPMTTDAFGNASASTLIIGREWWTGWGWQPFWEAHLFTTVAVAEAQQSVNFARIVFPNDIMMEHEYGGGNTAVLTTNRIVLDRLQGTDLELWSPIDANLFRGEPVDIDFTVEITKHVTTRTVRSRHYDHINRRTITNYDFHTASHVYRTFTGRTAGGRAVLTGLPYSTDQLERFTITVSYADSRGMDATITLVNQEWVQFAYESSVREFGFHMDSTNLRVGEKTRVRIVENPDPMRHLVGTPWFTPGWTWDSQIELTRGRMLMILARECGILSVAVGSPSGIQLEFPEAAISNAMIFGAYFDGELIFPVLGHIMVVNHDFYERELGVELFFHYDAFSPGEEVNATVLVTGPNGEPTAAQVAISVVDEASILSIAHDANFLTRLYRSSSGFFWDFAHFASFTQHEFGFGFGGAEGGGGNGLGGEPSFREFFVDNPVFELVTVGADGRGEFSFTLPDQITSWRVTALAMTRCGFAGDSRVNIVSYLPFYIDLILTNEFLVGDDIAALVRVHGAPSEVEAEVLFEVLQGSDVVFSQTQIASGNIVVNAGKLGAGEYTMRVYVRAGDSRDGVSLPFSVVERGLIIPAWEQRQIEPGMKASFGNLEMRSLPVRVSLTNANMQPLVNILDAAWDRTSLRTDYIAATAFIDGFFQNIWANGDGFVHQDTAVSVGGRIHGANGGVPELLHGAEDFFFTARFAASFPEFVNRRRLLEFIDLVNGANPWAFIPRELQIPESPLRESAEIMILASIGEPVLLRLQSFAHNINFGNSFDDKKTLLQLASALIVLGDYSGAARLMGSFNIGGVEMTALQRETINALLLFVNTSIDPQAAWEYLREKGSNVFVSDIPERINFVRTVYVLGDTVSVVEYYLHGETHTLELRNFDRAFLTVSAEQFENLAISPVSGSTDVVVHFYAYDGGNWDSGGERVQIVRTLTRVGDLVRVDFTVTVPERGFYVIYDRLPSNLRFVPMHRQQRGFENWFFVRNTQRQLVELSFFAHERAGGLTRRFSYFALELFEADMEEGVTYISNSRTVGHIWGRTR